MADNLSFRLFAGIRWWFHVSLNVSRWHCTIGKKHKRMHSKLIGSVLLNILSCRRDKNTFHQSFVTVRLKIDQITPTQVAADRGTLRIWRWVSLTEGGQKFWLQWELADTAWLACARAAATWSAAERPSNAPTQSYSLQRIHPHLNSIFASKLHARDPLHWVICICLIRWHGAHLQAVVIVMGISMLKIIDETSYL